MRVLLSAVVVTGVIGVLLVGCSASPGPAPTVTHDTGIPSLTGDWVLTRTVTTAGAQTGYTVGDTEKRYLKIAAATCSNGGCTGTLVTSDDDSVFAGGDGTSLGYHFDGTTFAYAPSPATYDCRAADDTVLIPSAYDVSYDIALTAEDDKPSGFAGSMSLTLTPASTEIEGQLVQAGCPMGGTTVFDATLDPR
ncbi:MAG: hypothetical protein ABUT11_04660 [Leifsonia sp.]